MRCMRRIGAPVKGPSRYVRLMSKPVGMRAWSVVRLVTAALILAAVVHQLIVTVSNALASTTPHGSNVPTVLTNFLSFFTIESNLIAVVAFALAGAWGLRAADGERLPRGLSILLACAATYMITTGIVYNILLRGIELPQGATVAWANEMMHLVGPLVLLADVLVAPGRRPLRKRTVLVIAAFPVVWAVYTLVRGPLVTSPATGLPYWYPYPFLNPHQPGGYLAVAAYIVGIAIVVLVIGAGVVWASRRKRRVAAD